MNPDEAKELAEALEAFTVRCDACGCTYVGVWTPSCPDCDPDWEVGYMSTPPDSTRKAG